MKFAPLLLALGTLAWAPATHAVTLQGGPVQTIAGQDLEDFSADGLLSFDLGLNTLAPVGLSFIVGADDGQTLAFTALISNWLGTGVRSLQLSVDQGVSFSPVGSAFGTVSTASVTWGSPSQALVSWSLPGENTQIELGNVFGDTPGAEDWMLNLNGLSDGQTFTLTLTTAVPEPGAIALVLAGLTVAGVAARRRQG